VTARFIAGFIACATVASCSIDNRDLQSGGDSSSGGSGTGGAHGLAELAKTPSKRCAVVLMRWSRLQKLLTWRVQLE